MTEARAIPGTAEGRARRAARRSGVALATLMVTLLVAEVGFRCVRERLGFTKSAIWELRSSVCYGENRLVPRAFSGWVFSTRKDGVNASGFIDQEIARERTPGVLRIACLGGSTTAGNVQLGVDSTYPGALENVLRERLGAPVEVMSFGVAGWTSANTLVNYFLNVQDYSPDVVILHHAVNDVFPRLFEPFRGDYSHYFHEWREPHYSWPWRMLTRWSELFVALQLREGGFRLADRVSRPPEDQEGAVSTLVPGTSAAFRRNIATVAEHVRAHGGVPVLMTMPFTTAFDPENANRLRNLGIVEHDQILRDLAEEESFPLLDLARTEDPVLLGCFEDVVHLSPAGNHRKAEIVADFLAEHGLHAPRRHR